MRLRVECAAVSPREGDNSYRIRYWAEVLDRILCLDSAEFNLRVTSYDQLLLQHPGKPRSTAPPAQRRECALSN